MNLNLQKGFGLIGIIIVVAVIAALAGGGLYWKEAQNQKSLLQNSNDALQKAQELKVKIERQNKMGMDETIVDTSNWKMYRDEKYGFEVKYPNDLALEFQNNILGLSKDDALTQFHIYDAGYVAPPGSTGAQVRAELREVTFYVYRFSQNRFGQLQSALNSDVSHSKEVGYYRRYNVSSLSGSISVYELMGIVGGYHYTYFSNNNYIFTFYTQHYDLGDQILSTLKFK